MPMMPPRETPWGTWSEVREVVPGVWRVKAVERHTPFFWLDDATRKKLSADAVAGVTHDEYTFLREGWVSPSVGAGLAFGLVVNTFATGSAAGMFTKEERTIAGVEPFKKKGGDA